MKETIAAIQSIITRRSLNCSRKTRKRLFFFSSVSWFAPCSRSRFAASPAESPSSDEPKRPRASALLSVQIFFCCSSKTILSFLKIKKTFQAALEKLSEKSGYRFAVRAARSVFSKRNGSVDGVAELLPFHFGKYVVVYYIRFFAQSQRKNWKFTNY